MDHIQNILKQSLAEKGLSSKVDAATLLHRVQAWLQEQNPYIAAEATPVAIKDNVLCIAVSHSIIAQELRALESALLQFVTIDCKTLITSIRIQRK